MARQALLCQLALLGPSKKCPSSSTSHPYQLSLDTSRYSRSHYPVSTIPIPDALSRLGDTETPKLTPDEETLDVHAYSTALSLTPVRPDNAPNVAGAYSAILVELSTDFRDRLKAAYSQDDRMGRVMELVCENQANRKRDELLIMAHLNPAEEDHKDDSALPPLPYARPALAGGRDEAPLGLRFYEHHGLFYFCDTTEGRDRLCIPAAMERETFELAHDSHYHQGFHRVYQRLTASVYMTTMAKRLRLYIAHWDPCQRNQTA